ncbi:hypothetical protein PoB_004972700 [Plakobranchus ocellatus]|uniref:Uncharacterized protein n=1 Tax=Plakobranchus ocellatus TaxID=259542 RepID=A0AAV4BW03_9GAST|nr:hypothetical protein PoB_004972700 [Plakobranchus ocellatus]
MAEFEPADRRVPADLRMGSLSAGLLTPQEEEDEEEEEEGKVLSSLELHDSAIMPISRWNFTMVQLGAYTKSAFGENLSGYDARDSLVKVSLTRPAQRSHYRNIYCKRF